MKTKSNVSTHELTYLYNVIIKQQPEVVAFHNGNVVSPVWTTEKTKQQLCISTTMSTSVSKIISTHPWPTHTGVFTCVASIDSFAGLCGCVNTASLRHSYSFWFKLEKLHLYVW